MIDDLRHALRTLARSPLVSIAVIVAMALGIGATTAIVSVVNGVLLKPLPFDDADRIVALETFDLRDAGRLYGRSNPWDVVDWRTASRRLSAISAWQGGSATVQLADGAARVPVARVAPDIDRVLGLTPAHGRFFEERDYSPDGLFSAVLGHTLWQTRFGGDEAIVGRSIDVNGLTYTVLGVLPPLGIAYPVEGDALWLPMPLPAAEAVGGQRAGVWLRAIGRLAPDATPAQATTEMETIVAGLRERHPATNGSRAIAVVALRDHVAGPARPVLLLIAGAVAVVLLVACASVGNVLLARAFDRRRELAVRAALGADNRRLSRLLLAESGLLAITGAVLGVLLAPVAIHSLQALYPGSLPRAAHIDIDVRVLAITLGATAAAALAASLPAILQMRRADLHTTLRSGERGLGTRAERGFRAALVVGQVALSAALVFAGTQLGRTFVSLTRTDPGFPTEQMVTFNVRVSPARYADGAAEARFHQAALERIRAIPGVGAAGTASLLPMGGGEFLDGFRREGYADALPDLPIARLHLVTPGFLEAIGMPLVAGRLPDEADREVAQDIAVVNATFQRRWFPDGAVGRRIHARGEWREIVGVVGDKRHTDLREAPQSELYVPLAQVAEPYLLAWYAVRASGDPAAFRSAIRQAVAAVDPTVAIAEYAPMHVRLEDTLAPDRFRAWLVGILAGLSLTLAVVGLWGLLAWTISRETREIGIRAALGQAPPAARRAVIGRALRLCAVGLALGLGGALLAARALGGFLAGVAPRDPISIGAVCITLLACAAGAAAGPAWRASRVHPMQVLRGE